MAITTMECPRCKRGESAETPPDPSCRICGGTGWVEHDPYNGMSDEQVVHMREMGMDEPQEEQLPPQISDNHWKTIKAVVDLLFDKYKPVVRIYRTTNDMGGQVSLTLDDESKVNGIMAKRLGETLRDAGIVVQANFGQIVVYRDDQKP